MDPPGFDHGVLSARVAARLGSFLRSAPHLGVVTVEAGFVLARCPDTGRSRDVAFVRGARLGGERPAGQVEGVPDPAIAVLSPGNAPEVMVAEVAGYLAAGATDVCVIDPETCTIATHRSDRSVRVRGRTDVVRCDAVLAGFEFRLDAVVPPLSPATRPGSKPSPSRRAPPTGSSPSRTGPTSPSDRPSGTPARRSSADIYFAEPGGGSSASTRRASAGRFAAV